jgi:hypothetical protein
MMMELLEEIYSYPNEFRRADKLHSKKACNPQRAQAPDIIPFLNCLKLSSILFWKSEEDG